MSEPRYYLDLNGRPLEGYKADEVAEALAKMLHVSPQKARNMLRGSPSRIQRDLEKEQALRLMNKVIACGAQCEITPRAAVEVAAPTADEPAPTAATEEEPRLLDLELERIDTDQPEARDSAVDREAAVPSRAREDQEARARAFERLNQAARAPGTGVPDVDDEEADIAGPVAGETARQETPVVTGVDQGRRRALLALSVAALVIVAGVAGWWFLSGGEQSAKVATRAVAERAPVVTAATRTEQRMKLLARSVRIWMIQYGAGFDPAQVTVQRMQQDLALEPDDMKDGWGTPFRYQPLERQFSIISAGPDAVFGTADDRTVTEKVRD